MIDEMTVSCPLKLPQTALRPPKVEGALECAGRRQCLPWLVRILGAIPLTIWEGTGRRSPRPATLAVLHESPHALVAI